MDQKLLSLLDELSKEIFHEENFHAAPSAKRIKAAMAEVNKYTSRDLASRSSRRDETGVFRRHGLKTLNDTMKKTSL